MKKLLILILSVAASTAAFGAARFVKATDSNVSFTGRVLNNADGSVSFDWTGVYMQTEFSGGTICVNIAESDTAYYNLFIDGRWKKKIKSFGKKAHDVLLADELRRGKHTVSLQRCTEGKYSRTTIFGINVDKEAVLSSVKKKERFIEVYGDSYTCGFGVESNRAEDPFRLETENCNDSYACIIARYFDADYAFIAHSGQGMIRDYGDKNQTSEVNMFTRHDRVFDDHDTIKYDFKAYKPNLVMINLGTNDFSPVAIPEVKAYVGNYLKLIRSLRSHYGDVPVLCITPHSANDYLLAALRVLKDSVEQYCHVHMAQTMPGIVNYGYDLGASWHPNRQGQRKIAMTLIPQVSAITKWDVDAMDGLLYPNDRDWAQIARYDADNERVMKNEDAERVVFLGNSITDFWPRRHAKFWEKNKHFVCRGISGQTSSQFVTRFREDVINLKPKTVVINAGTNDIAENTGMYDEDVTMGNIITMVELAQYHKINVVLSSVLPAKRFTWRTHIQPEDKIVSLNARIRKYAEEHNIPFADYYSALVLPDRSLKEGHSVDGVHPNAKGYEVMEKIILPLLK